MNVLSIKISLQVPFHILETFSGIIFIKMKRIEILVVVFVALCNHFANWIIKFDFNPIEIPLVKPAELIREISADVNGTINYDHANPYVEQNMIRGECSTTAHCYKGYCWAYCGAVLNKGSWYTTKKHLQSKEYIKCTVASDCNPCWNCAGTCGHWPLIAISINQGQKSEMCVNF